LSKKQAETIHAKKGAFTDMLKSTKALVLFMDISTVAFFGAFSFRRTGAMHTLLTVKKGYG